MLRFNYRVYCGDMDNVEQIVLEYLAEKEIKCQCIIYDVPIHIVARMHGLAPELRRELCCMLS